MADIKSNNPHLTGGEKFFRLFLVAFCCLVWLGYIGLTILRPWVPKYGTYFGNYNGCHYRHDERRSKNTGAVFYEHLDLLCVFSSRF